MRKEIVALKQALEKELEAYLKMRQISVQQKERVGDVEFLFSSLRDKQTLMIEIQSIEDGIVGLKDWWKKNKERLQEEESTVIEELFDKIEAVLEELLELEGLITDGVKQNKDDIERQLSHVSFGKKAVKAYYMKKGRNEARFVDRRQ